MKLLAAMLLLCVFAHANDELRATRVRQFFAATAEEVFSQMEATDTRVVLPDGRVLDAVELRRTLRMGTVDASPSELVDNTGSLVDALGVPGRVTLQLGRWMGFYTEGRDVRVLVLHEVLRMAGVNDDNYRHSGQVFPSLPAARASTRAYCNLRIATTTAAMETRRMGAEGFAPFPEGPMVFASGAAARYFPSQQASQNEAMDNARADLRARCDRAGYPGPVAVLSGGVTVQRSTTNWQHRNEYKAQLQGQCSRPSSARRPREEQRREACAKAESCRALQALTPTVHPEDAREREAFERTWRCP